MQGFQWHTPKHTTATRRSPDGHWVTLDKRQSSLRLSTLPGFPEAMLSSQGKVLLDSFISQSSRADLDLKHRKLSCARQGGPRVSDTHSGTGPSVGGKWSRLLENAK